MPVWRLPPAAAAAWAGAAAGLVVAGGVPPVRIWPSRSSVVGVGTGLAGGAVVATGLGAGVVGGVATAAPAWGVAW